LGAFLPTGLPLNFKPRLPRKRPRVGWGWGAAVASHTVLCRFLLMCVRHTVILSGVQKQSRSKVIPTNVSFPDPHLITR
jgi:hypothetical protein